MVGQDLVSREALLEMAVPVPGAFSKMVSAWDIVHAPSVEAAPVVYSKWVRDGDFLVCLGCDSEINVKNSLGAENKKNFCPCCGARMIEEA